MTHCRYRAATAAPRPRGREAKGADAPARRLRAALMSHHQGPMVSEIAEDIGPTSHQGRIHLGHRDQMPQRMH